MSCPQDIRQPMRTLGMALSLGSLILARSNGNKRVESVHITAMSIGRILVYCLGLHRVLE